MPAKQISMDVKSYKFSMTHFQFYLLRLPYYLLHFVHTNKWSESLLVTRILCSVRDVKLWKLFYME